MRLIGMCCIALLATVAADARENGRVCTTQDAIRAEQEASSLQNWIQVYSSYKRFAHCDDGAIAEGYSDSIARLLSANWITVSQLHRLASRNRGFEKFVSRHIDELMSPAQADAIRNNADAHCPVIARRLCKAISAKLAKVDADIRASSPGNRQE